MMVILFVKPVLKCLKMAISILTAFSSKNLFVGSAILKMIRLALSSNPRYFNGKKRRSCIIYIVLSSAYKSSINRDSPYFKAVYSLRIESERYNYRFKPLDFEKAYMRNVNFASNFNTFDYMSFFVSKV